MADQTAGSVSPLRLVGIPPLYYVKPLSLYSVDEETKGRSDVGVSQGCDLHLPQLLVYLCRLFCSLWQSWSLGGDCSVCELVGARGNSKCVYLLEQEAQQGVEAC